MINIDRPKQSPVSLQTQAIKDYLDELDAWENDITLPKPEPKPSYRNSDLMEAFDKHFFAKCYLTEKKFTNSYQMDVEHFFPKNEYPKLRYEWTNLYPADHDANMMKPRKMPKGGYLDPCNVSDDVENTIIYKYNSVYRHDSENQTCSFTARDSTNLKAVNTAVLLDRLHNGHNEESILKTDGLRFALFKRNKKIIEMITAWQKAGKENNQDEEVRLSQNLKRHLSRTASFTMLMRSTEIVKTYVPKDLLD